MLIAVSLNLPSTIEFDAGPDEAAPNKEDPVSLSETEAKMFLHEQTEPKNGSSLEVPFHFANEGRKLQPPTQPSTAVPNKGIVDDRRPISKNLPAIVNMNVSSGRKKLPESNDKFRASAIGDFSEGLAELQLTRTRTNSSIGLRHRRRAGSIRRHSSVDFAQVPWKVIKQKKGNGGLYNAVKRAIREGVSDVKWVGLLGMPTDGLPAPTKREVDNALRLQNCNVAYVSDSAIEGHYDNYCKELIWPLFHCQVPVLPFSKEYEQHTWQDYVEVNEAIARKVIEVYNPGDVIWVHDYHLMLVPRMVRAALPDASIGFFMHVAFPSSEVFRCLANRAELLEGMLASNLIGFQISEYVQHFMMTAARILAVDTSEGRVEIDGRDVDIMACAIGSDPEKLDKDMQSEQVKSFRKIIRSRWPSSKLIVARDKLGPTRGLRQKLQAYKLFLRNNPDLANKTVLIQVALSDSEDDDDSTDIETIADSINSEFGDMAAGDQPVVLLRKNIVFEQYLALIAEADAFIVSALRDGMNLTCHEFVYCNDSSRNAPLILSEFTGSASIFHDDALLVNPYDQKEMAEAFYTALFMPQEERERRSRALRKHISEHTGVNWVRASLSSIEEAWYVDQARAVQKPDIPALTTTYRASENKRLLIIEVGVSASPLMLMDPRNSSKVSKPGTAVGRPALPHSMSAYYSSRLTFVLRGLLNDHRNIIYVSSAESCAHMDRVFRPLPGVGLIAESGKYVRYFGDEEWFEIGLPTDTEWQDDVAKIIQPMQEMNLLRKVDFHESTIVLHMDQGPANTDERQRTTLGVYVSLINETFSYRGVRCRIEDDKMIVYTEDISIQRLQACLRVLATVPERIDFMMYANQPISLDADDVIYRLLERRKKSGGVKELVTILLGKHPTVANCSVDGINSLLTLLEIISSR